jgi:transcriptional regulator with XRE-family HTH domain
MIPELENLPITPPGNILGSMVRAIRKAKGISGKDLSQAIGRNVRYISDLETGQVKSPPYPIMLEIWRALDIDPDDVRASLAGNAVRRS